MRSLPMRCAALVCVAALLLLTARPANAQDNAISGLSTEAQAIASAINAARAQNGLPDLAVNSLLNQAAQNHVDDLIANGMYGHYGSDGSNVRTRVLRTGYPSGVVSENWVTSATPESAMGWWMNDWIHRVNILDASWDELGIGAGQVGNGYWIFVTDFADADGKQAFVAAPSAGPATQQDVVEVVPAGGMDYTVRPGDTLLGIGLRYGLEWQDIAIANKLSESSFLQIGQELRLPGIALADTSGVAEGGLLYTVKPGDTLFGIAIRHAITWQDIATANRLGEYTILQIGMQLRLPGVEEEGAEPVAAADEPIEDVETVAGPGSGPEALVITTKLLNPVPSWGTSRESATAVTVGAASDASTSTYVVKPGDTLFTIAVRNGITWQQLADVNDLGDGSLLQIGQSLLIPDGSAQNGDAAGSATPSAGAIRQTVEVRPGDTIIRIASRHGVGWKELLAVNGLDDNSILQPGQELILP